MKVLVYSYHYPSAWEPTKGTYNLNTFLALARHHDVRVVAPTPWWFLTKHTDRLKRIPREETSGLVATFPPIWSVPKLQFLHANAAIASSFLHMRAVHREFPFDAIVGSWAYPDAVAAVRFGKLFDVPVVNAVLGSDVNDLPSWITLRAQIVGALRASARVIAVSAALGERVVSLGVPRERVVVRRNGVNGEQFALRDKREARAKLGVRDDRKIIVYVGNIKREKATDVLIEAAGGLLRKRGQGGFELSIVGSGDIEAEVKARAKELDLGDHVVFRGRRLYEEIPTWMAAADVFVLPSRREGCPNVILEALASGRPVVASKVGGIPELVRDENGILVPAGDPGALVDALDRALDRSWSPEAMRASVESLSWNDVGDTYARVLEEVVAEHRARR